MPKRGFTAPCLSAMRDSGIFLLLAAILPTCSVRARAQELLAPEAYRQIRQNSSGELPYADFKRIIRFQGFSPSAGAEQVAAYLAAEARAMGLVNVAIEHSPAPDLKYFWAFRNKPGWDVENAQLWLERPERELLADFKVYKGSLARFSRSASVTAELVDVGRGSRPADYAGRSVAGKIVLASGDFSEVTRLALWENHAVGIVWYRTEYALEHPDLISSLQFKPWLGPQGQLPTFGFSLSYQEGNALRERLGAGERLFVHAEVQADTRSGSFPEVLARIPGTDPSLPVIVVNAHDNSRNTGGANNLTGVGCTLEIARLLSHLIASGALPRPRRTIRFMWGPEHDGLVSHFFTHPNDVARILAIVNIDMIGYSQRQGGAAADLRLYRSPDSNPSFLDDIVQFFFEKVGAENTISLRNAEFLSAHPTVGFLNPLFAPTGTRDEFHYRVEPFWGPSDHEDAQTFHIRAVLLNDYPDYYLGTQQDSPEAAGDPTQMRRGVVIGASAAYFLAAAAEKDLPALLQNSFTKAAARMAADESRAFTGLGSANAAGLPAAGYEARNVVVEGYGRESTALESLAELVGSKASFAAQSAPFLSDLDGIRRASLRAVDHYARQRAAQLAAPESALAAPAVDPRYLESVPARSAEIRGPVNLFRSDFGRWWVVDKTGDEHFDRGLAIAGDGEYAYYEALNLADGKRDIRQIRDALSAEFHPIPLADVYQYFQFLERLGVVRMARPGK